MKNLLLFILLFVQISIYAHEPTKYDTVKISLTGKKYDNLHMALTTEKGKTHIFDGQELSPSVWEFVYPDSLYEEQRYIYIRQNTNVDSIHNTINLMYILDADTLQSTAGTFRRGKSEIEATYQQTLEDRTSNYYNKHSKKVEKRLTYIDDFLVNTTKGYDQERISSYVYDYRSKLEDRVALIQKYPNSQYIIADLYYRKSERDKENLETLYNAFSKENKKTYMGSLIHRYINDNKLFENYNLPNTITGITEPIINTTSEYHLVIFSASWCGPCHKQIPILKDIHTDLGDKLDIVYVSIDEPKTTQAWKELVEKEQIPWHSLTAGSESDFIKDKYFVKGIPYSLLIHPNGKRVPIDVRKEDQREMLYNLFKK